MILARVRCRVSVNRGLGRTQVIGLFSVNRSANVLVFQRLRTARLFIHGMCSLIKINLTIVVNTFTFHGCSCSIPPLRLGHLCSRNVLHLNDMPPLEEHHARGVYNLAILLYYRAVTCLSHFPNTLLSTTPFYRVYLI